MLTDGKFVKDLKIAVKPECMIDDSIWFDWFKTFNGTDFYEQKVLQVAKSKKMAWPTSKSDETFGFYLSMQFSKVKSSLGWDAKRTLIICLAEEHQSFKNEISANEPIDEMKSQKILTTTEAVNDKVKLLQNSSGMEHIELTCDIALEIVRELISNNKFSYDMIITLNDHISRISKENKMLLENKSTTNNNSLHMKQLLDDMIKMSQDQIIDIDELSHENKRLMSELESYKSKYFELKNRYDKAKLSSFGINSFVANAEAEDIASISTLPISDNGQDTDMQRFIQCKQQETPVEVVHVQRRITTDSRDDFKI